MRNDVTDGTGFMIPSPGNGADMREDANENT